MRWRRRAALAAAAALAAVAAAPAAARVPTIHPGHNAQIWTYDASANKVKRRTHVRNGLIDFAWRPDGKAFAALENSTRYRVFELNLKGKRIHKFAGGREGTDLPAWSPDGTRLAFVAYHRGDEKRGDGGKLMTVAASGGDRRVLADYALGTPSWSPGGGTIYYHHGPYVLYPKTPAHWDVNSVAGDGSAAPRTVVNGVKDFGGLSPDGRTLLFTRGEPDQERGLWLADADGSNPHRLAGGLSRPLFQWTGSDNRIYVSDETGDYAGASLLTRAGGRTKFGYPGFSTGWSPDGSTLVHKVDHKHSTTIESVRPDGSQRRVLVRLPHYSEVFNLHWSRDGRVLAFQATREQPPS